MKADRKELNRDALEGDLYDLRNASVIVESLLEGVWRSRIKEEGMLRPGIIQDYHVLMLTPEQMEAFSFAIGRLGDMIRDAIADHLSEEDEASHAPA